MYRRFNMLLMRTYGRKKRFHQRREALKSSFKRITCFSKRAKRRVQLQFWLWRQWQKKCILGMSRAKRRVPRSFAFSQPCLPFKTQRNKRKTQTFRSSQVTTSMSSIESTNGVCGESCKSENSHLNAGLLVFPGVTNMTGLSELQDIQDTLSANSDCEWPVGQNSAAPLVLDQNENAEDDRTTTKLTGSCQFNICPKQLAKDVHEFLDGFHRIYGSFSPLEKNDVLKHLKGKFNTDLKDGDKIIMEVIEDQMALVEKPIPSFRVVYKKHTLTLDDLSTLANESWLNDQVINMYGELIMESADKVHFLNSFFHRQLMTKGYEGVKRWTKRVDLFSKSLLLVPVHLEVHWCLVTADLVKKKICLYDSQGNALHKVARNILRYLLTEAKEKKQSAFESDWTVSFDEDVPQQTNENDCGVFVLEYSRCLALSEPLQFSQRDIPKIRRRIYKELCECKLHEKD